jgi:SRSO17 transposase
LIDFLQGCDHGFGVARRDVAQARAQWDADALRDIVCDYALEALADDDAVRVVGETGFFKQGKASCGVVRQYTGSAGKITNCQIGVFACYVAKRGHAFIDRERYLPKCWTDHKARMTKAHVPEEMTHGGFLTKPALALAMIKRAIAAQAPFSFFAADTVCGTGDIETALRCAGKGYALGVKSNEMFHSWDKPRRVAGTAKEIGDTLPACAWRRLSAGAGTEGERLHDRAYLELADLGAGV